MSVLRISPATSGIPTTCGKSGLLIESVRVLRNVSSRSFVHATPKMLCSFYVWTVDALRLPHSFAYLISLALSTLSRCLASQISDIPASASKAETQKIRSEQQAAAQSSGKRNQIDFTSTKPSSSSSARVKEKDPVRKSRFQPYASGTGGGGDRKGVYAKEREKSRWG